MVPLNAVYILFNTCVTVVAAIPPKPWIIPTCASATCAAPACPLSCNTASTAE